MPLPSVLPVLLNRRGGPLGLATPIFSLSSLEPKLPGNVYLNNDISPSVVCVINRQNIILKYGMRGHFRYTLLSTLRRSCLLIWVIQWLILLPTVVWPALCSIPLYTIPSDG